eukprot:6207554-Pleurochrysis_carterae.AAC.4
MAPFSGSATVCSTRICNSAIFCSRSMILPSSFNSARSNALSRVDIRAPAAARRQARKYVALPHACCSAAPRRRGSSRLARLRVGAAVVIA